MRRHQAGGSVLGLDVGTTTVTCVALTPHGDGPDAVVTRPLPPGHDEDGRPGVDPRQLLDTCEDAVRSCVAEVGGRVRALGLSAGSRGVVGLDRSGRPLTDIVPDADDRAADLATALRRMPVGLHLQRATGQPVHPCCSLAGLMWWQDRDPELCGRVHTWVDLKGLLLHHLTRDLAVDRSSASASGLLDQARGDWHEGALELAGVVPEQLPRIVEVGEVLELAAAAAARVGLPAGTPVVAGAASHACGVLGVAADPTREAVLALDRGGALHAVGTGDATGRLAEGLSCSLLWQGRWVLGGELGAPDPPVAVAAAGVLERAGRTAPGADGLRVLPHLTDDAAPVWEGDLPGAVLGLRPHHRPEHLARAVFEGLALQAVALLEEISRHADVDRVVTHGRRLEQRWQLETLAAVLDRPVHLAGGPPPSALGAAALALYGLGAAATPEAARRLLPGAAERAVRVAPDPALVTLYTAHRRGLAGLAEGLGAVAGRLAHLS